MNFWSVKTVDLEEEIKLNYEKRLSVNDRYNILYPNNLMASQEKERKLVKILTKHFGSISDKKILEIGCGGGSSLLNFLKYGAKPENIYAIEMLPERVESAKRILPPEVNIFQGDAIKIRIDFKFDIIFHSSVFTSIIHDDLKQGLADKIKSWLKDDGIFI